MDLVSWHISLPEFSIRRAVSSGNSYSFSLNFRPKVNTCFQNLGQIRNMLMKLPKSSTEMFNVLQERGWRIKKI